LTFRQGARFVGTDVNINLNPFSAFSWSWRALRGHSVTFAALFALGLLGISFVAEFRHILTRMGAPWYAWFLVPMFAVGYLAKKEADWLPDVARRRRWARGLFFGSIVIAVLIAKFGPRRNSATVEPAQPTAAAQR
jgi:hypothetical protein